MVSRILRIIVCLLVLLGVQATALWYQREDAMPDWSFPADTIRCAIAIDRGDAMRRNVGFNYELLGAFGDENSSYMRILPPMPGPDCWRQLAADSLAIVVFNAADTIPSEWRDSVLFSMPVKGDIVWAVDRGNTQLLNAVNFWYSEFQNEAFYRQMSRRYFRTYNTSYLQMRIDKGPVQSLSPYDDLVRRHAARIGMDWRLLSAIIFHESQYNIDAMSSMSAKGLMQVRDVTADHYGIPTDDLFDPDTNIKLGTMLFDDLLRDFRQEGLDSANVIKFALASYNSGGGALAKRRAEAAEMGLNPDNWDDVAVAYTKYSTVTPSYIEAILDTYRLYQQIID
jgi:soluble lytic murein transglycosylase-like protein